MRARKAPSLLWLARAMKSGVARWPTNCSAARERATMVKPRSSTAASDPGAGVSVYRDGVLLGSPKTQKGARYSSYDILPARGNAPLRLGTRDRGSFFAGGLDEVALYPRVLTAAEIRERDRTGAGR